MSAMRQRTWGRELSEWLLISAFRFGMVCYTAKLTDTEIAS